MTATKSEAGVEVVQTTPYPGQKPGTSGLRKKVKLVQEGHYLHNFVQSIFSALPADKLKGATLLVSGDGRYYNREAIQIIAEIAAGNGVGRLWIGKDGLVSTPAASCIIRERENGVCYGGIILTASHNPGGPENDFGIKYNCANGEPALEALTQKIYELTSSISEFRKKALPKIDLSTLGATKYFDGLFEIEIIDSIGDWMALMKRVFDFDLIRSLISRPDFKMAYDGLHGVAGPYAKSLFIEELKASPSFLFGCEPKEDFGGGHPDPNLTYAKHLVDIMKVLETDVPSDTADFGAASDGDNDRNMILGKGFFVTPSDSVAIIAAYAQKCIPYFKSGLKGVARSMATSCALDDVAKKMNVPLAETPTGWKFFGNLMDAGKLSICGEESFGTGSDHIREKDGLWAVLAWLSILAFRNQGAEKLVSVQEIVEEFWKEYGRHYYSRYDYEEVDTAAADKAISRLLEFSADITTVEAKVPEAAELVKKLKLEAIDNYCYIDPVDHSKSPNQGVRCLLAGGSRIVWRLSGTGSTGSTVRIYLEKYEKTDLHMTTADALKDISDLALKLCAIQELTGRDKPTVIT